MLSIIACALLISRYGLPGAAFAMVLATTFQLVGSLVIVVLAIRDRKQESARPAKAIVGACCLP